MTMTLIAWDSLVAILCPSLMARAVGRPNNKRLRVELYGLGTIAAISLILRLGREKARVKENTSES